MIKNPIVKTKVKVYRYLEMENLRQLCISEDWYNKGDSEDYDDLLNSVYEPGYDASNASMILHKGYKKMDTLAIVDIAKDIYNHTEMDAESLYDPENFLISIIRKLMWTCTTIPRVKRIKFMDGTDAEVTKYE